jgi:hypothetical protein
LSRNEDIRAATRHFLYDHWSLSFQQRIRDGWRDAAPASLAPHALLRAIDLQLVDDTVELERRTIVVGRLQTRQPPSQCFTLAFGFFGPDRSLVRASGRVDGPGVQCACILRGVLLLIAFALSLAGGQSRAEDPPQRVLILHAYNYTFPANTLISDALRKRLLERSPKGVEIEADFLDLARRPDPAHAARMANFLREKYAGMNFDVVVMVGPAVAPFLFKYRNMIAPGVPVVFSDVTRATFEAARLPPDITAVINEADPKKTLKLAERLQPGARRLVVISESDSTDRRWREAVRKAIEARSRKLETV